MLPGADLRHGPHEQSRLPVALLHATPALPRSLPTRCDSHALSPADRAGPDTQWRRLPDTVLHLLSDRDVLLPPRCTGAAQTAPPSAPLVPSNRGPSRRPRYRFRRARPLLPAAATDPTRTSPCYGSAARSARRHWRHAPLLLPPARTHSCLPPFPSVHIRYRRVLPPLPTPALAPNSAPHRPRLLPRSTLAVSRHSLRCCSASADAPASASPRHSRCPPARLLPDHGSRSSPQSSHPPVTVHKDWSPSDRTRASNAVDCRSRPQMGKWQSRIAGS